LIFLLAEFSFNAIGLATAIAFAKMASCSYLVSAIVNCSCDCPCNKGLVVATAIAAKIAFKSLNFLVEISH